MPPIEATTTVQITSGQGNWLELLALLKWIGTQARKESTRRRETRTHILDNTSDCTRDGVIGVTISSSFVYLEVCLEPLPLLVVFQLDTPTDNTKERTNLRVDSAAL